MPIFVTISGCSGGGKSSLIAELARRGCRVVEEPGRRIVQREVAAKGVALPWRDPLAFAEAAIQMALADRAAAAGMTGPVFCDRGIIDALAAMDHVMGGRRIETEGPLHPLHRRVFMAPPWPEIYVSDAERPHGFAEAGQEYGRLLRAYATLGYELVELPKIDTAARADFLLATV